MYVKKYSHFKSPPAHLGYVELRLCRSNTLPYNASWATPENTIPSIVFSIISKILTYRCPEW